MTLASQKALIPHIASVIESIEGPNEIKDYAVGNGTHGPGDRSDRTKDFAANSLTIASGDPKDYAALPGISPFADAGSVHFYAGNGR